MSGITLNLASNTEINEMGFLSSDLAVTIGHVIEVQLFALG